ncbi:leucine-rich repeat extensin-like protein 4 [Magnolia sinica]|uniref:leucine-rich repeat extensin-like protein 4 n=1 Tax=Magnolia sinica TaxID=86752 RepID=UPI00265B60AD|nr:leucine-rich repeat extensin-like protein 4 [Magnolia sinica]
MQNRWFLCLLLHTLFTQPSSNLIEAVSKICRDEHIITQSPLDFSNSKLYNAHTALQAWKSSITSDPSKILDTWVGPNVCDYKGVFCSKLPGTFTVAVAGIDLKDASLEGTIPKELSLLSDISFFHLNSNKFIGTVPDSFKDLQSLSELDLSNNNLSGPFPSATLLIPNLNYLDLRFNNFVGPIPEFLFTKGLDAIFLNDNMFDDHIPDSIGYSTASVITLANNKLTGRIPSTFGYTVSSGIHQILLMNNKLTGRIPEEIGFLTQLEVFDVSHNALSGQLPASISCLSRIEVLNLGHNRLCGVIPDLFCSLKFLTNLTVSFNFFYEITQGCKKLPSKNLGFDFSTNCISGIGERPQHECTNILDSVDCLRLPTPRSLPCKRN